MPPPSLIIPASTSSQREQFQAAYSVLEATQRDALHLRVIEERSYEEIALQLGISQQTVRARVSRGLRALAHALEPYHAAHEGCVVDHDTAAEGA